MSGNFPGATTGNPFGGMTPGNALGGGLAQQDPATGQPYGADPNVIDPVTGLPRDYTPGQPQMSDPFGGMTPGDALGGGLTQIDPATGLPYGQTAQAPGPYTGIEIGNGFKSIPLDPFTGRVMVPPSSPMTGDMLGTPVDTPRINYPGQTFGPRDLSTPGPQQQPQPFPNLMQNPAFNPGLRSGGPGTTGMPQTDPSKFTNGMEALRQPGTPLPGNPQQLQNIAQGQQTLVNQLAPPPPPPGPGFSITQQPAPMSQAQPQPRFPALMQNPAFSQPGPVNQPAQPEQANINSLAQVLSIMQRNPTFAPGAAGQFNLNQLPSRAPQTMRPQTLPMQIRQPAPNQVLRTPTARPYILPQPVIRPQPQPQPQPAFRPQPMTLPRSLPAPSLGTQSRLQSKLTNQFRPTK